MQKIMTYDELDAYTRQKVDTVIGLCKQRDRRVSVPYDTNGDVYAYPRGHGEYSWGVNGGPHGFLIAQGIRK